MYIQQSLFMSPTPLTTTYVEGNSVWSAGPWNIWDYIGNGSISAIEEENSDGGVKRGAGQA